MLGGAAVSEQAFSGHAARLSGYAYLVSVLPAQIARDLGIDVELRPRRLAGFAPPDVRFDHDGAGLGADRDAFRALSALTSEAGRRLAATWLGPLPSRAEAERLLADVPGAWELLAERPIGESLRERFASPLVRGVLGTDAIVGTLVSLFDPSLRQNRCFAWHVCGGPWRVPVGGMGALSDALAGAARRAGAELRTGAEVLAVDGTDVTWREDGEEHTVSAGHVLLNAAPRDVKAEGSQLKLNMLLDRLPRLRSGVRPEDAFTGTFHVDEDEDALETAYEQAVAGGLPERPPFEVYCHSLTDRSILGPDAPAEQHTLTAFVMHTPARLFKPDERAWHRNIKVPGTELVARVLDGIDAHLVEPLRDCLALDAEGRPCLEVKTPQDLERELGMPGGNIFHGDLDWPWAEAADEEGGWGVETADPRVLRCGATARRGGCVSGIGGQNAAMAILFPIAPVHWG